MMSEVIVLSDSNESDLTEENESNERNKRESQKFANLSNFEFPEVRFDYNVETDNEPELWNTNFNISPRSSVSRNLPIQEFQKSSSTLSEDKDKPTSHKNRGKYNFKKPLHSRSDSADSKHASGEELRNYEIIQQKDKVVPKKSKTKISEERQKRQEQVAREKALKAIALKKSKDIKPGECMKFIEVIMDKGIENFSFHPHIIIALNDANIQYSVHQELIPNSVSWKRKVEESYVDESNKICTTTTTESVDQLLLIWNWDETVLRVSDDTFTTSIYSIKALVPERKITLVIYGVQDYFTQKKKSKVGGSSKGKSKTQKSDINCKNDFKNFPEISKRKLEVCLNEIQITSKTNSRLVNTPEDLAIMISQYTKAVAEIPFKLEKNNSITNKFDWYVMGDNRNTVRVDKDGNGLKRLWQQQLCQFNLSSLEIAEAICSVYPSPGKLMQAYMNCSDEEGINLLKDIPIRRAAGPLTATRRVGIELSKKIYTMFTSEDGEALL